MPVQFDDCVKRGGKVRTIVPEAGKYIHVCYIDGNSYAGEVKTKQTASTPPRKRKTKGVF